MQNQSICSSTTLSINTGKKHIFAKYTSLRLQYKTKYPGLFQIGIFLILTGMLFSRFMLSMGMLLLLVDTALFYPINETVRTFLKDKTLVGLTSLFFLYLLTGFYSADKIYFWERVRIVLPLLFLPFSFAAHRSLNKETTDKWLYYFFLLVSLTAIYSFIIIYSRYGTLQIVFDENNHLVTPINHVRYSLMVAFSIFIGIHVFRKNSFKLYFKKTAVLFFILFLIFFLHFISVRSGLFGFYAACLFLIIKSAFNSFSLKKILPTALLTGILFFTAYKFLPSFRYELLTTKENINAYLAGRPVQGLSDNWRIRSIEAGLHIGKDNFCTGVGLGDVKTEMKCHYSQQGHGQNAALPLLPHNQFVYIFTFSGIFGLVWFGLVW